MERVPGRKESDGAAPSESKSDSKSDSKPAAKAESKADAKPAPLKKAAE